MDTLTCFGGPLDGDELPTTGATIWTHREHPDGYYQLVDDTLYWQAATECALCGILHYPHCHTETFV